LPWFCEDVSLYKSILWSNVPKGAAEASAESIIAAKDFILDLVEIVRQL